MTLMMVFLVSSCNKEQDVALPDSGEDHANHETSVSSVIHLGKPFTAWASILPQTEFNEYHTHHLHGVSAQYCREWILVDGLSLCGVPLDELKVTRRSDSLNEEVVAVHARLSELDAKSRHDHFMALAMQLFQVDKPTKVMSKDINQSHYLLFQNKGEASLVGSEVSFWIWGYNGMTESVHFKN